MICTKLIVQVQKWQLSMVYFDKPNVFVTTVCESRELSIVFGEFVPLWQLELKIPKHYTGILGGAQDGSPKCLRTFTMVAESSIAVLMSLPRQ